MATGRYRADLTAGSLKLPETRVIAGLLLDGATPEQLRDALITRNVLKSRNPATSRRIGALILQRLRPWDAGLWRMIRDGSSVLATQATLAAAIKHSALLADFLDLVVREQYRVFASALNKKQWESFIEDCRGRDAVMAHWNESTITRLRSTVFQILAQAGYLESSRSLKLQKVILDARLVEYLKSRNEAHVLRCMQVHP